MTPGLLPSDCHYLLPPLDDGRKKEDKSETETASDTTRRPSWTFAGFLSPLSAVSLSPSGWMKSMTNQKP